MERYSRQIMLPDFGTECQQKLAEATVGILGAGGLGCPAATYLAAAGIGRLIIADSQYPEESNLNRQILHWPQDISNKSKATSAAWKLEEFNPDIEIIPKTLSIDEENIATVFADADILLDCTDSFEIRMILNEYCIHNHKPYVHAAVEGWHGQVTAILPGTTPCLRCIFPNAPSKKDSFPIMGAAAGTFGCLEAAEAVKILTGVGEPLASKLLVGDLQYNQWDIIEIARRDTCPACKSV